MSSQGFLGPRGQLAARHLDANGRPKAVSLRLPFNLGRLVHTFDPGDAVRLSREYFQTHLHALHLDADGNVKGSHHLGSGLVTHAGVRLLSQDTAVSAGAAALSVVKFHASGTGTTSATDTDTALQTAASPTGTTAVTGSNSNADASPNATVSSVATLNYTSTLAITEWGLFNQATLSGATMFDHKVFAAINVVNGDSIQFTYVLTINAGG